MRIVSADFVRYFEMYGKDKLVRGEVYIAGAEIGGVVMSILASVDGG